MDRLLAEGSSYVCVLCVVYFVWCRLAVASPVSGDQTYVSQEVCTSVLHEVRGAIKRASAVSCSMRYSYNVCKFSDSTGSARK